MRKKLLYLVALIGSFAFTANAQCDSLALTVGGGSWTSEISWDITADTATVASGLAGDYSICLEDGLYSFNMYDSYGDGWSGSTFNITAADSSSVATGGLTDGSSGSVNFTYGEVAVPGCTDASAINYDALATEDDGSCIATVAGCTDSLATNYNADANVDDASCVYPYACAEGELILSMVDSYGDGWGAGNEISVNGMTYTAAGAGEDVCVAGDACLIIVGNPGGSWASEASWSISSETAELVAGDLNFNGTVGECSIAGCTDSEALNYDELANEDDGSCEYYSCDATDVTITVGGGSYDSEVSWSLGDMSGGAPYSEAACLTDGLYTFNMVDSYGDGWNGAVATVADADGNVIAEGTIASGAEGSFDFWIGMPVYDCSMAVALSGEASSNTDGNAWHSFDMADAGSATVSMVADSSDFGASATVYSDCDGTVADASALAAGTYYVNVTQDLPDAEVAGSDYTVAVSISIVGCTDAGAANYNAAATEDDGSCEYILGCTDPIAENYDASATTDDGSCTYVPGCTDATALNYDPSASEDDGSCLYVECEATSAVMTLSTVTWASEMGASVTNSDGQVLIDIAQGSLLNATDYTYDLCLSADSSYQVIMTDSYGDGWSGGTFSITTCDGVYTSAEGGLVAGSVDTISFTVTSCDAFIFGCTDTLAANFNTNANEDDGSCEYLGCTDADYLEFDAGANVDDGSCATLIVEGCSDAAASNFNPDANVEDGSCILPVACDSGKTGMIVYMSDSYGDGWNGNYYDLTDASGASLATGTIATGSAAQDTLCVDGGCYTITVAGGSYQSEVSWSISTEYNGPSIANGGSPLAVAFSTDGSDCSYLLGCNDPYASNYNADAIANDGSCEYATSEECDSAIVMDVNSSYNGAFNEQVWFSITLDSAQFVTADASPAAGFFYEGDVEIHTACDSTDVLVEQGPLDAGTYLISVENSSIFANGDGYVLTVNAADVVEGCTDIYAANYDETANIDDASCLYPCEGIDANINISIVSYGYEIYWELLDDQGMMVAYGDSDYENNTIYSVPLCLQEGVDYTMNSYDNYGDGWNGGTYEVVVSCGEDSTGFTYLSANNGGASPTDGLFGTEGADYALEASEVFTIISCDSVIAGCMDETAFNYNPEANVTDGNCVPFIYGCMDTLGLNYDALANTDDSTCVYGCDGEFVTVTVTTVTWGSEISWELLGSLGDTILSDVEPADNSTYNEDVCLGIGESFVFSAHDSYGDGWNSGGSFSISSCSDLIEGGINQASGNPPGSGEDYYFTVVSCDDVVPGCTSANAINYNADATHTDGSCEFPVPSLLTPVDGSVIDLATTDSTMFTWEVLLGEGESPSYYNIYWSTDMDDLEGSVAISSSNFSSDDSLMYTDYDGLYNLFVDNGYGPGSEFELYWWVSNISYFNEGSSEVFSGANQITLTLTALNGCTDTTAINFNPEATVNDGTCTYPCDSTALTLMMYDSYGDGWNGNAMVINGESYTIETGDAAVACVDVDLSGCVAFAWTTGSYVGETSWVLYAQDGSIVDEGANGTVPMDMGECVLGCTDEAYAQYNADADIDDGSCVDLLCADDVVLLTLTDSYGDTWNGGTITINGSVYEQPTTYDGPSWSGEASDTYEVCLDLSVCNEILYTPGSFSTENSWSMTDADGNILASGGAESGSAGAGCAVLGCTDPTADNYNASATEDDGSCDYSGCTDPAADNYDASASIDDGSCMYSCGDAEAQIDVLVTTDTYASETSFTLSDDQGGVYSVQFSSANNLSTVTNTFCVPNGANITFVLNDSYGDGIINGGYEIFVCEESMFTNFSINSSSATEEFMAVCGEIMGCTDASALNYNSIATADDGSCEYPCTDIAATLTMNTTSFAYEIGWSLEDADGNQIAGDGGSYANDETYLIDLCLQDGMDYQFNMSDSYGDGWGGATFSISADDCGELAAGGLDDGDAGLVAFTVDCGSTACEVPSSWDVTVTGSNHTIMVPAEALIADADGNAVTNGAVGVFFTNSVGDLQCAGYTLITGETVQIAAMGDDTTTPEVDGLTAGGDLVWMIWNCDAAEAIAAIGTYTGGPETYTTNGLTFVESVTGVPAGPTCQTIDFPAGWSMFSTYMIADDMDLASVLAPIVDNVIIAKNNSGAAYLVEWAFNGVGEMVVGQGYQIKTDAEVSLEICGDYAFPEDNPIALTAGWNMVGFLRTDAADAISVLDDVNSSGNLIIAKDYNGAAYLPEWAFNGIGDMVPGQGYQLKTNTEDVLQYLSNDASYRTSSIEVTLNEASHYAKVVATDNNMTVIIEDASWDVIPAEGSEVAAYDAKGNLIGSALYTSPLTVLTVWGDDAMTSTKDGLFTSEVASFELWTKETTASFEVTEWVEGSSSYSVDAINVAGTITTNVVAETLTADRVLVKVINVLGQEVENVEAELFEGKVLFNVYNDGSVEKVVK